MKESFNGVNGILNKRPQYNFINGQFLKGHIPHNKGKSWNEWMPKRKRNKVLKNLEIGRNREHPCPCAGWNAKKVIVIDKLGIPHCFDSCVAAGNILGIESRNINSVCNKKRKRAGGKRFFFEDDPEIYEEIKRITEQNNRTNDIE